ncbi:unnamed protein product [Blepharisma stoltei]|uniref:Ankyrin repeat domain-containing protein n=1 Tax=Blepharisma stoltei TaxID=1481888 RepID=A0AAU9KDE1_9CILI|nr:unnamed protein product [Blepharisma stoltei]
MGILCSLCKKQYPKTKLHNLEAILQNDHSYPFSLTDLNERIEFNSWSYLHLAVWLRKNETASALIRMGADTSLQDIHGETPLHLAALRGNYEIYQELIDAGSIDSLKNFAGKTPYEIANELGLTVATSSSTKNFISQGYENPSFGTDTDEGLLGKTVTYPIAWT